MLIGTGFGLFVLINESGNYLTEVLPGVVVLELSLAVTVAPLTPAVLAVVPAKHAGVASAVNNDTARAAALVTVALLPPAGVITGYAYRHAAQFSETPVRGT